MCHAGEGKVALGMTGSREKSCRRGESSFWHDREAEESHAGERKVAFGMTGEKR